MDSPSAAGSSSSPARPSAAHISQHYYSEKDAEAYYAYTAGRRLSPSSATRSSGTVDTLDVEKQALEHAMYGSHEDELQTYYPGPAEQQVRTIKQRYDEEDPAERESERLVSANSVRLLLFFTFALPLLSLLLAVWTILIVLALTLLHPVRLIITRKRSLANVILSHLAPVLNIHLEVIYASPLQPEDLRVVQTVLALLGAAPLSMGVAFWTAVLGVYWFLATMIGNPDGLDARSEGREMLLTTRGKWAQWLAWAETRE